MVTPSSMAAMSPVLLWAIIAIALAGVTIALVVALPTRRVAEKRRLLGVDPGISALSRGAHRTANLVTRAVGGNDRAERWGFALDRAGIRRPLPEFVLMVGAAALVAVALGTWVSGLVLGLFMAVLVVIGAAVFVAFTSDRRRSQFADQLDDLSQLLATNLRAGHSIVQSLGALAVEVEEPARTELSRAVNQVRVGRDLGDALDETARRMASEDFAWLAQAVAIHRQVGGNLADVLDTVSETIRERNKVRRQVHALSAEGRLSALILMALPVIVGLVLAMVNPIYFETFTQTTLGWIMLAVCALLMTVGGFWLRRLTQVEY